MSAVAMVWAWQQQSVSATAKMLLLKYADQASDDGVVLEAPSGAKTAASMGMSERSVWRVRKELADAGLIRVEAATIYLTIPDSEWAQCTLPDSDTDVSVESPTLTRTSVVSRARVSYRELQDQNPDQNHTPPAAPPAPALTAQRVVAGYVDEVRRTTDGVDPPRRVIGQVAKQVGDLCSEGYDPATVARAVSMMVERRLNPATLPSLILEAVAGPKPAPRRYGRGLTSAELGRRAAELREAGL